MPLTKRQKDVLDFISVYVQERGYSPSYEEMADGLSLASVAAGADGITVEVHINPEEALCDKEQALTPRQFSEMMQKIRALHQFMDRMGRMGSMETQQ